MVNTVKDNERLKINALNYFAYAKIYAPNTARLYYNVDIYVTTKSYPGGLWAFEIVDLDGQYGIVPVSPTPRYSRPNGVQYTWGSYPSETKTVKITVWFRHTGVYKLHVWGGARILSHAEDVTFLTVQ